MKFMVQDEYNIFSTFHTLPIEKSEDEKIDKIIKAIITLLHIIKV